METRSASWFLAFFGLVVLGSFFARGTAAPRDNEPAVEVKDEEAERVASATTPTGKLEDAFNRIGEPGADHENARYVVATLPDPVDSHVAYKFDRYVSAIQRAAEGKGYVLDRFSFPWQPAEALTTEEVVRDRIFRVIPGFLLFRKNFGEEHLMVFLVGETPTGGVHREALEAAMNYIEKRKEKGEPMMILGPSFSGSAASLVDVLRKWKDEDLRVISGAATSVAVQQWDELGGFRATVPRDPDTATTILCFLQGLGVERKRIALLSEATTAYGRDATSGSGGAKCETAARTSTLDNATEPPAPDGSADDNSAVRVIYYPLQISELRGTRARERTNGGVGPSHVSTLPLEDHPFRADVPHVFSPLEPYTIEATLSQILGTIEREDYHYVGLLGTDIKDRLFLAREIRRHSPDVTLFTFSADILYLNPGENGFLRGMLVATPYPLFGPNQSWTGKEGGPPPRLQFADSNAQGIYNAMVALLESDSEAKSEADADAEGYGDGDGGAAGAAAERPAGPLEYRPPPFAKPELPKTRPPLWISVVGRDALWPVTLRDADREGKYMFKGGPYRVQQEDNGAQTAFAYSFALFALALLALYLTLGWLRDVCRYSSHHQWLFWPVLEKPAHVENEFDWSAHLLATRASVLVLYVQAVGVWFVWDGPGAHPRFWLWIAIAAGLVPLTAGCFAAGWEVLKGLHRTMRQAETKSRKRDDVLAGGASLLFSSALVVWTAVVVYSWGQQPRADRLFLYLRSVELQSGVSVLVPSALLTAVGLCWGYTMLARLRLMESLPPGCLDFENGSLTGIEKIETGIRDALAFGFHAFSQWPLAFVGLWTGALLIEKGLLFRPLSPTLAGEPFDYLLKGCLVLANFLLLMTFFRLIWIAVDLRQFLRRLSWHPILEAFARIPRDIDWAPFTGFTGRLATFADVRYSLECATRLVYAVDEGAFAGASRDPHSVLAKAESNLSEALSSQADGDWLHALKQRCEVMNDLAQLVPLALECAEAFWKKGERTVQKKEDGSVNWPADVRFSEEFLASRFAIFVHSIMAHLRNFAGFLVVGLILMLLAISSFPFQPRQLLLSYGWIVIVTVVGTLLIILVQMEQDVVISRMSGTSPGKIGWTRGFVLQLAGYVVLPLLSLFAAQFPDVGTRVTEWLQSFATRMPPGIFGS